MTGDDVLIVDDDADIRLLTRLTIEQIGYSVGEADGAMAALDLLRSQPKPSVILLDLQMGAVDGFELRQILDDDPELRAIPVLLFSAHVVVTGDIPDDVPAFAGVVRKPAMDTDLSRILPQLLGPPA